MAAPQVVLQHQLQPHPPAQPPRNLLTELVTMLNSHARPGNISSSLKKNLWRKLCSKGHLWEDHAASMCCKQQQTIEWMTLLMNLNSMLVKVSARIGFSLFETGQCLKTQPTCKVRHLRYRRPLLCITRAPLVWFLNKGCIMTSNQNPVKPSTTVD